MTARASLRRNAGFTLIEVLVALVAMALMAGLGWRGLDGLLRAREASQARVDQMVVMQTALAQWQSDLDTALSVPGNPALPGISWDGRVLRILRRASVPDLNGADAGLWVVSWTVRTLSPDEVEQMGLPRQNPPQAWVRTQAPASTDRQVLQQYWAAAVQGGAGSPAVTPPRVQAGGRARPGCCSPFSNGSCSTSGVTPGAIPCPAAALSAPARMPPSLTGCGSSSPCPRAAPPVAASPWTGYAPISRR